MRQRRQAYCPDLVCLHRVCEQNYHKFLSLWPFLNRATGNAVSNNHREIQKTGDSLLILNQAPYTTTVRVVLADAFIFEQRVPQFDVCLYHDVAMAEVIVDSAVNRLHPVYSYPNCGMYYPDEKEQLNRFLAEWLAYCMAKSDRGDVLHCISSEGYQ
ncbi:hypothetical protein CI610_00031 [invertebrate metagenome]|uniref:Dehydrogenase n=1 Tax=invertebrate metagenome TaxID=1711999 RepID=A0A2H9TD25_9ZZZZ